MAVETYHQKLSNISESDFKWLAGVIDTEGSLMVERHRNSRCPNSPNKFLYSPRLKVAMTSKEFIQYLQSTFGGSECRTIKRGNRRTQWKWEINGRLLICLIPKLIQYLIIKKRQAEIVLEAAKLNYERDKLRRPWHPIMLHMDKLEILYNEIRTLNKRGMGSWL